ncbi:MAG: hypothetical protein JW940_06955 [Polyangiaceae bacterium]|nr:hypothetical protein [Polyangiaceae bacterium]
MLSTSHDQSWHLAGYVTECVRKACLTIAPFRKALAHEQGRDADALLEVVLALDGRASRLRLHGWAPAGSKLAQWSETHRYDRTGAHADTAAALVDETALLLDATLAALWLAYPFDPGTL